MPMRLWLLTSCDARFGPERGEDLCDIEPDDLVYVVRAPTQARARQLTRARSGSHDWLDMTLTDCEAFTEAGEEGVIF